MKNLSNIIAKALAFPTRLGEKTIELLLRLPKRVKLVLDPGSFKPGLKEVPKPGLEDFSAPWSRRFQACLEYAKPGLEIQSNYN